MAGWCRTCRGEAGCGRQSEAGRDVDGRGRQEGKEGTLWKGGAVARSLLKRNTKGVSANHHGKRKSSSLVKAPAW